MEAHLHRMEPWALAVGGSTCVLACVLGLVFSWAGVGLGTWWAGGLSALESAGLATAAVGLIAVLNNLRLKRANAGQRVLSEGNSLVRTSPSRSPSGACGCSSPQVACTLGEEDIPDRAASFSKLFKRAFIDGERLEGSAARWRFRATPDVFEEVLALAGQERACCPFFSFEIEVHGEEIWWDTSAPEEAALVLEAFYRLPWHLASEGDGAMDIFASANCVQGDVLT